MNQSVTIIGIHHTYGQTYRSIGGVGGFVEMPETSTVTWSDGTKLVVEDQTAVATYRGTSFRLQRIDSSLHDRIVDHWKRAITKRLDRDAPVTRLTDRVRSGWQSELPNRAA